MMIDFTHWRWELLSPFFGVLLTTAFAPYNFAYVSVISLGFLYLAWQHLPVKTAALRGYLFGLGLFGCGNWYLYISIHEFGGGDALTSVALTALFAAIMALFPALLGVLTTKILASPRPLFRAAAVALLWVIVENLRGYWILNGFPWLQIAYSQLETPLAGFAPLLGVYGVGFLLAISTFLLVEVARCAIKPVIGCLIILAIWVSGAALQQATWTEAFAPSIKVALLQGNIDQDEKWLPTRRLENLKVYQQLTAQHWDAQVIVWPETSVPAFLSEVDSFFLQPLEREARRQGTDLVISLPTEGEGDDYYNSAMTLGHQRAFYHKSHLLPFGEYLPLQPLSGWVLEKINIPLGTFNAGGEHQSLLMAGGQPFVTTICYEDAFGELVSRQIAKAAYIVNLTNDAWFGDSSQPHQHMQMAQMRALESGRYLLRATNTGLTGIVGPDGKIIHQAPQFARTVLTGEIVPMTGLTPYARLGDSGVFLLLTVLVVGLRLYK